MVCSFYIYCGGEFFLCFFSINQLFLHFMTIDTTNAALGCKCKAKKVLEVIVFSMNVYCFCGEIYASGSMGFF